MIRSVCLQIAIIFFAWPLLAQTNTWNGTTNTDWGTASNWSLNLVPTSAHDVVIPNSNAANANPVISITNAVCNTLTLANGNRANSVTVNSGATLVVSGAISMQAASASITKAFIVNGTVVAASLSMADPGTDNRLDELSIGTGSIVLTGDLTMPGNATRNKITFTGSGTLSVGGAMTGGGLTAGTGTVIFWGSGAQTIPAYTYYNLSCTGSNTKTAAAALTVGNNLNIASGVTMNMSTFALTGATITTTGTGTLRTQNNTATPIPTGRTWAFGVTFDLAGNQTIPVGTYSNLETGGSGIKTLSGNTTVSGTLTFTSGKIDGGTNTLTLTSATPATQVSGGSPSSYIYNTGAGRLRRNNLAINTNNNFPVGSPTYFNPVVVKPLDAVKDFAVSMFEGLNQDGTSTGTPLPNKNPVVNATWNVDLINGDPGNDGAEITLSWNTALEGAAFATFTGPQIGISHFTTGNWQLAVGSGDNTANTATATFDSFSPFAVGKVGTVLPISFTNLKAYEKQRGVQVDWKVTADKNVSTYVVERSADGRNFSKIGTVTANQSDLASAYGFYDAAPLQGTGYYRIASQQKDGSNSLSAVLRVNLNKSIKETIIYPNPVKGSMLSLQSTNLEKGNYSIRMYSVNGQELLQLRFDHNGGAINQMINLPKNLQPGMYDIMLDKAGSRVMSKKVMVQ